jgi:hypothetical protein
MYSVGFAVDVRTTNLAPTDGPRGIGVSSSSIEKPPGTVEVVVSVGATVLETVDVGVGPGSPSAATGELGPNSPQAATTTSTTGITLIRNRTFDTVRRPVEATT